MKITIDNHDGQGDVDYSSRLCGEEPIRIERQLNAPSHCSCSLNLYDCELQIPGRNGRVKLQSDSGLLIFTGYISLNPELVFVGEGTIGSAYRFLIQAVSDDLLLDRNASPLHLRGLSESTGQLLRTMADQAAGGQISTADLPDGRSVGIFEISGINSWSANARILADLACSHYRILDSEVAFSSVGDSTHIFDDAEGTLQKGSLKVTSSRPVANDITVSGEVEPATYISQYFTGDGSTSEFNLAEVPFRPTSATAVVLEDSFGQEDFDPKLWSVKDSGAHLAVTGAGLTMNGGSGTDGETILAGLSLIELGGSLVIEANGLRLEALSVGTLCGLYIGSATAANCLAGYSVSQAAGLTVVTPLVNGIVQGASYSILPGHRYILRIRTHCAEMYRVRQTYYTTAAGDQGFGGGLISAPLDLVFEIRDLDSASSTPATVLFEGVISNSPAIATFLAVTSTQIYGSIASLSIRQGGSVWITSTLTSGTRITRLIGTTGEGVDCTVSGTGTVTFLPGRIPAAGELIEVTYRTKKKSVSRFADATDISRDIAAGLRGSSRWTGAVLQPIARTSEDCESTATAILSESSNADSAISGTYEIENPEDIWPGDSVQFRSAAQAFESIVRSVAITSDLAFPEVLSYRVAFAGEWAKPLGVKTSDKIASDASLPQRAIFGAVKVLENLRGLRLISTNSSVLQVDTGVDPPSSGGFEVRRRETGFGSPSDPDVVLRSAVRSFSIPREAQVERYFVRMYDGSNPPVYSRFSSAVFTDLPVG